MAEVTAVDMEVVMAAAMSTVVDTITTTTGAGITMVMVTGSSAMPFKSTSSITLVLSPKFLFLSALSPPQLIVSSQSSGSPVSSALLSLAGHGADADEANELRQVSRGGASDFDVGGMTRESR